MTSINPHVPLALVANLAGVSEQRAALPSGPKHVSVFVHAGTNTRSARFAIETGNHWDEMIGSLSNLIKDGPTDSVTIFYPTDDAMTDFGVLLSPDEDPLYLAWTSGPKFDLRLAPDDAAEQLKNGAGIEVAKALLKN